MTCERWLPIEGYGGLYEVSSAGRVRSLDRVTRNGRKQAGRVLKPCATGNGYVQVALSVDGEVVRASVHRLVAAAFLGSPAAVDAQVNHKNGRKGDNRSLNLEWCSAKANARHASSSGLLPRGEGHWQGRLTDREAKEIRSRYEVGGESQQSIAEDFGVSQVWVSKIVRRQAWAHV